MVDFEKTRADNQSVFEDCQSEEEEISIWRLMNLDLDAPADNSTAP